MQRRASFSLVLLLALVLCAACPASALPISGTTPSPAAASACEFFGTRFISFSGWRVEEHRESSEPLSRVSLDGYEGTHHVLVSIIPREMRAAEPTSAAQAAQYFRSLRAGMTDWTNVSESRFEAPARSYPVAFGRRLVRGPLPPLVLDGHPRGRRTTERTRGAENSGGQLRGQVAAGRRRGISGLRLTG